MFDFSATTQTGKVLKWKRVDVDGISINVPPATDLVIVRYSLFAKEMSVRSNHLDTTHLHLMPPFTWFWPERGIEGTRLEGEHRVELVAPEDWTPATQLQQHAEHHNQDGTRTWSMGAEGRDLLLDSIIEVNPNPTISHEIEEGELTISNGGTVEGTGPMNPDYKPLLMIWNASSKNILRCLAYPIGQPTHGTAPDRQGRGGLEHMNSQTSMMPRQCLFPNHKDEYRDLVTCFHMNTCTSGT